MYSYSGRRFVANFFFYFGLTKEFEMWHWLLIDEYEEFKVI